MFGLLTGNDVIASLNANGADFRVEMNLLFAVAYIVISADHKL